MTSKRPKHIVQRIAIQRIVIDEKIMNNTVEKWGKNTSRQFAE